MHSLHPTTPPYSSAAMTSLTTTPQAIHFSYCTTTNIISQNQSLQLELHRHTPHVVVFFCENSQRNFPNYICLPRGFIFPQRTANPIIVIDNYDSFTYSLCQIFQYTGELICVFEVYRNDKLTVDELKGKNTRGVLISLGPGKNLFPYKLGTPQDSRISLQTVLELEPTVLLFGVCIGLHQYIAWGKRSDVLFCICGEFTSSGVL